MSNNYLSEHETRYLHRFAELHDERKALTEVFGKFTPRKRHMEIMAKPLARKELKKIVSQAVTDMEQSSASSLKRLMNIQSATLADFIDLRTGAIKDDIEPQYLDAIKSIKYDPDTGSVVQIILNDKLKAIETSLKFTGMLNKKIDVNVHLSISEQLQSDTVQSGDVTALLANFKKSQESEIIGEIIEEDEK